MEPLVGCRGFPVARERYFAELRAVEISDTRKRLPKLETARRWRDEAPQDFEFSLVVPAAITHPAEGSPRAYQATGHFRDAPLVRRAWEAFEAVAGVLRPAFTVFETPPSFYPHAGHLKDMYAFFRAVRRGDSTFVWAQHGGGWEPRFQEKVAKELRLVVACDPVNGEVSDGRVRYIRVSGRVKDRRVDRSVSLSDSELRGILHACGTGKARVFLGNADSWRDARRLRDLAFPGRPRCAA